MRIQHNIMAMSAYRNYTNNVSAMKKNLEKLSSGYKINRAGDDAAGLAISEKMRAQITGLETAQKNAKDGISLVQTAEGALTEVHDMLNRMVELATQSANGTYDNATDRNQLQKELNQLRSEIDRIADSSNFNGIKLLDGSMSSGVTGAVSGSFDLPEVGLELGVDTVLHNYADSQNGTEFSVELHNFEFNNKAGDSLTITLGEGTGATTITLTAKADGNKLTGNGIAAAILAGSTGGSTSGYTVTIGSSTYTQGDTFQVGGQDFTLKATADAQNKDGAKLTFVQTTPPVDKNEEVNGSIKVSVSGNIAAVKAQHTVDLTNVSLATGDTIMIGTTAFTATAAIASAGALATALASNSAVSAKYTVTAGTDGNSIVLEEKTGGVKTAPTVSIQNTNKLTVTAGVGGTDMVNSKIAGGVTATAGDVIAVGIGSNTYTVSIAASDIPASGTKEISLGSGVAVKLSIAASDKSVTIVANASGTDGDGLKVSIATGASTAAAKLALAKVGTGTATLAAGAAGVAAATTIAGFTSGNWVAINGSAAQITIPGVGSGPATVTIGGYKCVATSGGSVTITAPASGTTHNGVKVATGATEQAARDALHDKTTTGGVNGAKATASIAGAASWTSGNLTLTIGTATNVTIAYNAEALAGDGVTTSDGKYKATMDAAGKITLTAINDGAATAGDTISAGTSKASFVTTTDATVETTRPGVAAGTMKPGPNGDYNVSTTDIKNVSAGGNDRLASTYFDLKENMVLDGASIKIADKTYVFSTNKDTAIASGSNIVKVDISKLDSKASDYLDKVAKAFTDEAAKDNAVYTVGHDGKRITLTESYVHADDIKNDGDYPADDWDLRTMEGIKKSLGFSSPGTKGNGLTLQIGDTAEDFNQLKVDIKDCHTASMGDGTTSIKDISIETQEDAAKAVDVIKAAINYVSDVRGTLGATQNRLDHTINNLSVMTENIQDAESTIRDTDVADEMMAYTKNNILIQSAQAMLAQANQVPQGVLQLLQ